MYKLLDNIYRWRHIIELRASPHAQWEIRKVANEILKILKRRAPTVFGDFQIDEHSATAYTLSVSPGTIRNWVSQRYIPHARRGRVVRFHRRQIDAWLAADACPGRHTIAQRIFTGSQPSH